MIFVDWHQADAFCRWLSEKEGRTYRLPTEAEWEYACRAGSCMHYSFGDRLPKAALKNQEEHHSFIPVDLTVAQSAPNAFGLYDMHGNVEEWCYDWYGPYFRGDQTDPVGYADGFYKVTRGGSHSTPVEYLRSANRMAMIPEDKHFLTGFRIIEAPYPATKPVPASTAAEPVAQHVAHWVDMNDQPRYYTPIEYVIPPHISAAPMYPTTIVRQSRGAVTATCSPSGSRRSANSAGKWLSGTAACAAEPTRGTKRAFCGVPDRNMTGSSLRCDPDSGRTPSAQRRRSRRLVAQSGAHGADLGRQRRDMEPPADRLPGTYSGTSGHRRHDPQQRRLAHQCLRRRPGQQRRFGDSDQPRRRPELDISLRGKTRRVRSGTHRRHDRGHPRLRRPARDGSLMAFGRGNDVADAKGRRRMTRSISGDMGKTWRYEASPFPPISGGQRCTMIRLKEGPIVLVSFTYTPASAQGRRPDAFGREDQKRHVRRRVL
ncbi:MAG: SUMF1/EgtB/PvdO family nonheme iron enzyme [Alistipes onderdonkii]